MKLSPHYLKRYKDLTMLVLKYGNLDMSSRFGSEENLNPSNGDGKHDAEDLPNDLEKLGPTFVKLGQLLSSRPDLLPPRYTKSLSRLQDKVKPFPYQDVEFIIETELRTKINKAFLSFEREPLAAASLGQVHRAALHDGRQVVVKVQRPNIIRQIDEDFAALEEVAKFLHRHTRIGQRYQMLKILEEFERTLAHELDYQREAANLSILAKSVRNFPRIKIPEPVADYTTRKILTMEYVEGTKITEISPLARLDLQGSALADELFKAYLQQILVDGTFHADPHPGNVLLTADRHIVLLDVGMVGHTSPAMQENLLKLLLAVSEGASDEAADVAVRIGNPSLNFQEPDFRQRIGQIVTEEQNATLSEMDIGKVILNVGRTAAETGLFVPTELSLLGKTLLQLDEIGRILDPEFNPNESVRRNASQILNQRLKSAITEGKVFSALLEAKQFLGGLPTRLNKILDAVGTAELKVNVQPSETEFLVDSARKVANRITTGLILAALIIGAALLMRVPTAFQIMGYPGLAMLCFLAAAGGGFWLVLSILWQDHTSKQKSQRQKF
jgi:predicted unusual protein kinase regulating ubiquinone biosynthesis (AarF/ABC1/UbiB family)